MYFSFNFNFNFNFDRMGNLSAKDSCNMLYEIYVAHRRFFFFYYNIEDKSLVIVVVSSRFYYLTHIPSDVDSDIPIKEFVYF